MEAEAELLRIKIYMVLAVLGCILLFASFLVLATNYIYKTGGINHKQLIRLLASCRLWRHLFLLLRGPAPRGKTDEANNSLQLLTYSYSSSNTLTYSFQLGDNGGFANTVEQADSHESLLHRTSTLTEGVKLKSYEFRGPKRNEQRRGLTWTWQRDGQQQQSGGKYRYRPVQSFDEDGSNFELENVDLSTDKKEALVGLSSDMREISTGLTAYAKAGPLRVQGAMLVLLLDDSRTGPDISNCEDDSKHGGGALHLTCAAVGQAPAVGNLAEVTSDRLTSEPLDGPPGGSPEESLLGMRSERRKSGRFSVESVSEQEEGTPQQRKVQS
jgi:hypothetical protein